MEDIGFWQVVNRFWQPAELFPNFWVLMVKFLDPDYRQPAEGMKNMGIHFIFQGPFRLSCNVTCNSLEIALKVQRVHKKFSNLM